MKSYISLYLNLGVWSLTEWKPTMIYIVGLLITETGQCRAGSGCPITSRWLLLESGGLVLTECSCRGARHLCLSMERFKQQSESETATSSTTLTKYTSHVVHLKWTYLYVAFRWLSYVIWGLMMVSVLSSGPGRVLSYPLVQTLVKFRYLVSLLRLGLSIHAFDDWE